MKCPFLYPRDFKAQIYNCAHRDTHICICAQSHIPVYTHIYTCLYTPGLTPQDSLRGWKTQSRLSKTVIKNQQGLFKSKLPESSVGCPAPLEPVSEKLLAQWKKQ